MQYLNIVPFMDQIKKTPRYSAWGPATGPDEEDCYFCSTVVDLPLDQHSTVELTVLDEGEEYILWDVSKLDRQVLNRAGHCAERYAVCWRCAELFPAATMSEHSGEEAVRNETEQRLSHTTHAADGSEGPR